MHNCSTVPMQTIFEQPHCQCEQLACDHCLSVYRRRRRFLSEACGGGAVPTQPLFDQRHLQWQRGARCADHHQRRTNDGAQTAGQLAHHAPGKDCFPPFSTATVSTLAYDFRICWLIFLFYLPRDSVYLQTTLAMRVINSVMSAFRLFICFRSFCWTSWSFTSICYMCMGHDYSSSGIESQGLGLSLAMMIMWSVCPQSSTKSTFSSQIVNGSITNLILIFVNSCHFSLLATLQHLIPQAFHYRTVAPVSVKIFCALCAPPPPVTTFFMPWQFFYLEFPRSYQWC